MCSFGNRHYCHSKRANTAHSAHSIPKINFLDSHRFHGFFAIVIPKGVKYNYWVFFFRIIVVTVFFFRVAIVVNIARDQRIYATKFIPYSMLSRTGSNVKWIVSQSFFLFFSVVFCRGNIRWFFAASQQLTTNNPIIDKQKGTNNDTDKP